MGGGITLKKSIRDYDINGKKVIIRCDFNVPILNNKILDDTRIKASLKTINYARDNGAKVILMSHLGKVKTEEDKCNNSLFIVSVRLSELLGIKVKFSAETKGSLLENLVNNLNNGDVLLIENTRFEDINSKKESSCDMELSKYWAGLGDIFIDDAYAMVHRKHASNVGIARYLDNGIGFLVEEEVNKLDNFMGDNSHPLVVVMGGKKVEDKIGVINNLITKCDKLLVGGGMCFTFLKAEGYNVGSSIVDNSNIEFCREMLNKYSDKIVLPVDIITAKGARKICDIKDSECGYDIGSETIEKFSDILKNAKRCIINGPMGVYEDKKYSKGTSSLYTILKDNNVKTLVGGGDSASSVNNLGFEDVFYHVSTGGGATLEYLGGKILPGIDIIMEK